MCPLFGGLKAAASRSDRRCVANVAGVFSLPLVSRRLCAATFHPLSAAQGWSCDVGK